MGMIKKLTSFALILSISLPAQAGMFPQYDKIMEECSSVMTKNGEAKKNVKEKGTQGKFVHCKAAYDAHLAKVAQMISLGMWSALAGLCTTGCVVQVYPWGQSVAQACTYASMGVGAAEMVASMALQTTYQHSLKGVETIVGGVSGLTGLISMGVNTNIQVTTISSQGHAMMKGGEGMQSAGASAGGANGAQLTSAGKDLSMAGKNTTQTSNFNAMVCVSAAMATAQAIIKGLSLPDIDKAIVKSTKQAEKFNGNQLPTAVAPELAKAKQGGEAPERSISGLTDGSFQTPEENKSELASACGDVESTKGMISCATAYDKNLPQNINTQKFADDFKGATGNDLGAVLSASLKGASAPSLLANAANPQLGVAAKSEGIYKDIENKAASGMMFTEPGGTYARGRGGSGAKGKDLGAQMGDFMSQFMKTMQPGEQDRRPSGVSEIDFKLANKRPDEIEQDTSISLFDRIGYRYRTVITK